MCSKVISGCVDWADTPEKTSKQVSNKKILVMLVFGVWNKNKICKLLVYYKQTAEFICVFIGFFKLLLFISINNSPLNKFVHKGSVVIPVCFEMTPWKNKLTNRLIILAYRKNGLV